MRKQVLFLWLAVATFLALSISGCVTSRGASVETRHSDDAVTRVVNGTEVFAYRLRPPPNSALPLEAGGYFHPLTTPAGIVVTDFAPSDHKHHRGVFLAWVEMHGAKSADFWGWGEHAPTKDRKIVNRDVAMSLDGFRAANDWVAEDTVLIQEELTAAVSDAESARVLDLIYKLTPKSDLTLSRWAFSGFCVRVRKDGEIAMHSPDGTVTLKDPVHTKPETDWPDAAWYAAAITLPDGKRIGAAVINHPRNPPTLWHNHRTTRMLNPCIVAPGEVKLKRGEPLTLRYRVVTFGGEVPASELNKLANEWRNK